MRNKNTLRFCPAIKSTSQSNCLSYNNKHAKLFFYTKSTISILAQGCILCSFFRPPRPGPPSVLLEIDFVTFKKKIDKEQVPILISARLRLESFDPHFVQTLVCRFDRKKFGPWPTQSCCYGMPCLTPPT